MREKITPYERKAQFSGGAAQNSARAENLHGRRVTQFIYEQLPSTDGSLALNDPPRRPEKPPIKIGTCIRVLATLFQDGVKRLVEGVLTILSAQQEWVGWLFRVEFNGIIQFWHWKMEDIIEAWRCWWAQPRQRAIGNGKAATPAPAPILSLPAPRIQIAGLLPERCA